MGERGDWCGLMGVKGARAPLAPGRGEGSGVRGETQLRRAAWTVREDAGFAVGWER
jgi:hypothetical protein